MCQPSASWSFVPKPHSIKLHPILPWPRPFPRRPAPGEEPRLQPSLAQFQALRSSGSLEL